MSERVLEEQFALLRAGCGAEVMRSAAVRTARLKALYRAVRAARQEILGAFQSDCGRPEAEVRRDEIEPVLAALRRALAEIPRYERPVRLTRGGARFVGRPFGVVLVTADWTAPFRSMMESVINAAAAGNCVMLRPVAEMQSVSAVTVRLLGEVFPRDAVTAVHADLAELLALPFDARYVHGDRDEALRAAETMARSVRFDRILVRRKHWCVVFPGIGVGGCARRIVRKKFRNAGQHGDAPDYLLVHKDVKDALMIALRRALRRTYGDNPGEARDFARIADDRHYARLAGMLDHGRLVAGGEHNPDDRYIAPTVLDQLDEDCALLRKPVAGPILPVFVFETPGEALAIIRRHPEAGTLSVFGATRRVRERMLELGCERVAFQEIAESSRRWTPDEFRRMTAVTMRRSLLTLLADLAAAPVRWGRTAANWFAR